MHSNLFRLSSCGGLVRRSLAFGVLLGLVSVAGCASTVTASYPLPREQVELAAREAVASVGYPSLPGSRPLLYGFFVGSGGDTVDVQLTPADGGTDVVITTRKQFLGFLAQRHYAQQIARYLDAYLEENAATWAALTPPQQGASR